MKLLAGVALPLLFARTVQDIPALLLLHDCLDQVLKHPGQGSRDEAELVHDGELSVGFHVGDDPQGHVPSFAPHVAFPPVLWYHAPRNPDTSGVCRAGWHVQAPDFFMSLPAPQFLSVQASAIIIRNRF
jgi:hypothetical protein